MQIVATESNESAFLFDFNENTTCAYPLESAEKNKHMPLIVSCIKSKSFLSTSQSTETCLLLKKVKLKA